MIQIYFIIQLLPKSIKSIIGAVNSKNRCSGVCFCYPSVSFENDHLGPNFVVDLIPFVQYLLNVILKEDINITLSFLIFSLSPNGNDNIGQNLLKRFAITSQQLYAIYLEKFIEIIPDVLFVLIFILRFREVVPRSRQNLPSRYHFSPKDFQSVITHITLHFFLFFVSIQKVYSKVKRPYSSHWNNNLMNIYRDRYFTT